MPIRFEGVGFTFPAVGRHPEIEVLRDVTFDVEPGELIAVVGASGAGKSTLLRLAAGALHPSTGTVLVGEHPPDDPASLPAAYQPQRDLLLPWRRVLGNAVLAADAAGVDRHASRRRARELLVRFGLGEFLEAWPAQLSGGMRQRVALLRAHLSPASLMLLDEPLGSLDALTRRELQTWLQELYAERPRTTLLVTHDIEEALLLADRVVVLSARPATIAAVHDVPWPRPRRPGVELTTPFVAARADLLAALAGGVSAPPAPRSPPP